VKPVSVSLRHLLLSLLLSAAALHAQLPVNNDAWKTRCNLLAASAKAIEDGTAPPLLVAATHGVAGKPFYVLALNRSQANQHYVACTLYYLAAISERAGNGGKSDPSTASDDATLASAEAKEARGDSPSFYESWKRFTMKFTGLSGTTLTVTAAESSAVLNAATTMPLSLIPPPPAPRKPDDSARRSAQ